RSRCASPCPESYCDPLAMRHENPTSLAVFTSRKLYEGCTVGYPGCATSLRIAEFRTKGRWTCAGTLRKRFRERGDSRKADGRRDLRHAHIFAAEQFLCDVDLDVKCEVAKRHALLTEAPLKRSQRHAERARHGTGVWSFSHPATQMAANFVGYR